MHIYNHIYIFIYLLTCSQAHVPQKQKRDNAKEGPARRSLGKQKLKYLRENA